MKRSVYTTIVLCLLLGGCTPAGPAPEQTTSPPPSPSEPQSTQALAAETPEPEAPLGSGEIVYQEGVEPLTAEQEAAIHAYMTAAYEALARLEEPDFAALFTNQTQAAASEAGISLQIALRTMTEGVDYSLTGYRYTLNCRETAVNGDGTVSF